MFSPSDKPRIFGTAPGTDFAESLVAGLLSRGDGYAAQDWARIEIFVSTARMQRRIREVFDQGPAMLLPRIRLLTELANDPRAKFGKAEADASAVVEQAKSEASRLTEKAGADLSLLLERRSAAFDQRMSQLQAQAQNDLKSRAAELAIGALRKSLPDQLDAAALASLADNAIDDLPNRV